MTEFDLTQTDKLLSTTRAVRKRLDLTKPVPRDLVLDCVRLATQAPAGGNYQRWRWLIVDAPEQKAIVADAYKRGYAPYIESQKAATGAKVDQPETTVDRIISSSDHLANIVGEVPVLAIPCAVGEPEDVSVQGSAGWWGSLLPAVWSYMLAARSRGLGTVYTTLHLNHAEEVGEALGIPAHVNQLAMIPTAFYTGETFRPGDRMPAEKITYWNEWKNTEI